MALQIGIRPGNPHPTLVSLPPGEAGIGEAVIVPGADGPASAAAWFVMRMRSRIGRPTSFSPRR